MNHPAEHLRSRPSVELQDVRVHYGAVTALAGITFALPRGADLAIVGPNGAGKSTLFGVIAGTIQPNAGKVTIYGSGPQGHICVGYVPQRNQIDRRFPVTVRDVVMMGRTRKIGLFRYPHRQDRDQVQAALAQVGMSHLANRQIGELSGGQQQRVFLARALAQEAELLLLDEPLTGLDLPSQEALLTILHDLRQQGITMLVATHDLNQAAAHFSTVMLLNRRLIAIGAPAAVLTTERLTQAYGGQLHVVHRGSDALILADSCCGEGLVPPFPAAASTDGTRPQPLLQE